MERRNHLRMPVDAPVFSRFTLTSGESLQALLVDISRSGAQCKLPKVSYSYLFELAMPVYFFIDILFEKSVVARVVRLREDNIAVHFAQLLTFSEEELQALLKRL